MTRHYLLGSILIYWLFILAEGNPLPGPPIFYKTNTFPAICYLPPDSGACTDTDEARLKEGKDVMEPKQDIRYYFDTVTETCYPFSFFTVKPCSQNKNNFKSLDECKSYCKLV